MVSFARILYCSNKVLISTKLGTAISAAPVGVGALKSATKSAIVKSISCPTAEMIGILELKIALATISSLNAHKSSIDPPPRPQMMRSNSKACATSKLCTILSLAPFPWTNAGNKIVSQIGYLLLIVLKISRIAAPVGAVIIPILFGNFGIGFLYSFRNKPSSSSFLFNFSYSK